MRLARLLFVVSAACSTACADAEPNGVSRPWSAPALEHATSIRDNRSGERISLDTMVADLETSDIVFLGETHTDETTHRLELYVYEALLERRDGKVVLAMEMFHRDDQANLDAYLAGEIDEGEFARRVELWNNYREAYRPLVERAKKARAPVVASNFPKSLLRRLASKGSEELSSLTEDERTLVPREFFPNPPSYWRRVDNAIRGHAGMMPPAASDDGRVYSVQSLWDNAMGDACASALKAYAGHTVLHINGGFHSAFKDGTVHQARLRAPEALIKTISIVPSLNPSAERSRGLPAADYTALVESRANNLEQGTRSVTIGGGLDYVLHRPAKAVGTKPTPLLIWLCDDGLSAKEVMPYCAQLFGELATVAVVQPPYKAIGDDLAIGGRWYWSDSFAEDTSAVTAGTERIWAYLLRNFSIDPARVCLVGEGAGATVAAAVATRTDRLRLNAVAVSPRRFAKLKDLPLLLPQLYPEGALPQRRLSVIAVKSVEDWWGNELREYEAVGIEARFLLQADNPWKTQAATRAEILAGLGFDPAPAPQRRGRRFIRLKSASARESLWARIQAHWLAEQTGDQVVAVDSTPTDEGAVEVATVIPPSTAAKSGVIPRCPGPFGGTTIVLLPEDIDAESYEQWLAIESNDPLNAESRFHRTRLATVSGNRPLASVLEKLSQQNRKNVLIVPAVFFADRNMLGKARAITQAFDDEMTIRWMPGLGGRIGALPPP